MDVIPEQIPYLALAASQLGPLSEREILQRGEAWQPLASPFLMLDREHLRNLRESKAHFIT